MSTPKIRTTVYSHKVIDVVSFNSFDTFVSDNQIEDLFNDLAYNLMEALETGGNVHIKIDRPLSAAEQQHRLGVISKNVEKKAKRNWIYERRSLERERAEYERLKEKYGE